MGVWFEEDVPEMRKLGNRIKDNEEGLAAVVLILPEQGCLEYRVCASNGLEGKLRYEETVGRLKSDELGSLSEKLDGLALMGKGIGYLRKDLEASDERELAEDGSFARAVVAESILARDIEPLMESILNKLSSAELVAVETANIWRRQMVRMGLDVETYILASGFEEPSIWEELSPINRYIKRIGPGQGYTRLGWEGRTRLSDKVAFSTTRNYLEMLKDEFCLL